MIIKNIKSLLIAMLMVGILSAPFIGIAQGPVAPNLNREDVVDEDRIKQQEQKLDDQVKNDNTPEKKECKDGCCGIKLNTNFPGIGTCITFEENKTNPTNVFQKMTGTLTKLIMGIVLVICFITIIIAGIMWAGAGEDSSQKTKAKKLIERVAITILLIGFSGVILRLINPNFFG